MENITLTDENLNARFAEIRELKELLTQVIEKLRSTPHGQDTLLTREQAANRLQISTRTLDTLESNGEIRAVRIRGRVLYQPEALDAFIRQCAKR